MLANQMPPEQAAENWDLPLAAIQEAVHYCELHQDLLRTPLTIDFLNKAGEEKLRRIQ